MTDPVPFRPFTYLAANAERWPEGPAIYELGEIVTFGEFFDRVGSLAVELRAVGVGPGDVVGVLLGSTWQYVALEIAVPALGAVILPLSPSLGAYELESALKRSSSAVVVTDFEGTELVETAAKRLGSVRVVEVGEVASSGAHARARASAVEPHPTRPDDVVQIAMTSGTTGLPKLASLSAELKQLTFEGFTGRLGIEVGDRVLPLSPVSQGVGEMCLYALRVGACLVMTHERRFSADRGLELAEESRATVIGVVPTMIRRMLQSSAFDPAGLESVRVTAVAGAPMPPDLAESWERRTGSRVCGFFGAMDIGQLAVASPEDPQEKRWHTVGRPHVRAEVMICDPDGRSLDRGGVGEICMRGPLVQSRYWNERYGPFAEDGWAHFGDVGFIDDDGFVHVSGRMKDIIIRGGENINPYELEAVLVEHPDVSDVCVVGVRDPDLGERVAACVVGLPGHEVNLESLREFLKMRGIARHKWVERLVLIDQLPLGGTGKILRRELRDRVERVLSEEERASGGGDADAS